MIQVVPHKVLAGIVSIPSSKSDGQRALITAALSHGTSILRNVGQSDDEIAMLRNIKLIGASVVEDSDRVLKVTGVNSFPLHLDLNVGESGLGLRLLSGICAVQAGRHKLNGVGSILKRDQSFFERNLTRYGGHVSSNEGKLPLLFEGEINANVIEVDGSESSQYISGLLMGLALNAFPCNLKVNDLKSGPYVDMTMNTMEQFGVKVENDDYQWFHLNGKNKFQATTYTVESDWSSASYWLAAAAIGFDVSLSGLNLKSKQADIRFLDALKLAGCTSEVQQDILSITQRKLVAFQFDATDCPDLFPALVVLAAKCQGTSIINGVSRLANKESNRGIVLQKEFGKLGVPIELDGDVMRIEGNSQLKGARVSSNEDHRIAMSLAILGTTIEGGIEIESAEAVSKSYPQFWGHLKALSVR